MSPNLDPDLARNVLECLPIGIFVVDRGGKIILWSSGAEKLTGYLRQDVLGHQCGERFLEHFDESNNPFESSAMPLLATLREGKESVSRASIRDKSGRSIPVQMQTVALRDTSHGMLGAVEIFEEIAPTSMQSRRQNKLAAFGCVDTLTGILNHSMIQAHLKEQLSLYSVYPVPFSVMCFALNDLPKLRERYGQAAIDSILRVVAQTLENALRPTDFLGRWMEQEFLAILTECGEEELPKVGARLKRMVEHSEVIFWGEPLRPTVSVGASIAHDLDTPGLIINRAEKGLRKSMETGASETVIVDFYDQ